MLAVAIHVFDQHTGPRVARATHRVEGWSDRELARFLRQQRTRNEPGVWVDNQSGEQIPANGIMAVSGGTWNDTLGLIRTVVKPSVTFRRLHLVNGDQAIPAGEKWFVPLRERYKILYDSAWTPAYGHSGGPKPGEWKLFQNFPATTFVEGVVDATAKILEGSLSRIDDFIGKTTGAVTGPTNTTSYKIYKGALGSEADAGFTTVDSGRTIEDFANDIFITGTYKRNGVLYLEPFQC